MRDQQRGDQGPCRHGRHARQPGQAQQHGREHGDVASGNGDDVIRPGRLQPPLDLGVEPRAIADEDRRRDAGGRGVVRRHPRAEHAPYPRAQVRRALLAPRAFGHHVHQRAALHGPDQGQPPPGQRVAIVGHSGISVVGRTPHGAPGPHAAPRAPLVHARRSQVAPHRQRGDLAPVRRHAADRRDGDAKANARRARRGVLGQDALDAKRPGLPGKPIQMGRAGARLGQAPQRRAGGRKPGQRRREHGHGPPPPGCRGRARRGQRQHGSRRARAGAGEQRQRDAGGKRGGDENGKGRHRPAGEQEGRRV